MCEKTPEQFLVLDNINAKVYLQVPSQFVESMLTVHSKFTEVIKSVFNSDQQFIGALDKVWDLKVHLTLLYIFLNDYVPCVVETGILFTTNSTILGMRRQQ